MNTFMIVFSTGCFFLWAFILTIRLARAVPKDGRPHLIGGLATLIWSTLAGLYGLIAIVLVSYETSVLRSYGGLFSTLIPSGSLLLLILYKELRRGFMGGHKPFVNPWCDDIAEECHRPEF